MRKFSCFLMSLAVTLGSVVFVTGARAAETQTNVVVGKMVYAKGGKRLGAVYRVAADGSAQVILDGKLVTIPNSTLTTEDGKLETSMSKSEVVASR